MQTILSFLRNLFGWDQEPRQSMEDPRTRSKRLLMAGPPNGDVSRAMPGPLPKQMISNHVIPPTPFRTTLPFPVREITPMGPTDTPPLTRQMARAIAARASGPMYHR